MSARAWSASTTTAGSCASRRPAGASPPSSASRSKLGGTAHARARRARSPRGWPTGCSRPCAAASPTRRRRRPAAPRSAEPSRHRSRRSRSPAACRNTSTAARPQTFGDLGALLAQEIRARVDGLGAAARARDRRHPRHRHRRLAIHHAGERQHHLRLADGSAAAAQRAGDRAGLRARRRDDRLRARWPSAIKARAASGSISIEGDTPVAVFVPWRGSATFQRLDGFCQGVVDGLASVLAEGHPLVLAGDGDVGGLIGIHLREEMQFDNAIVSIDGLELKEFDYIDIGAMLPNSGAVPVVIKSLIFPTTAALGHRLATRSARTGALNPPRHLHRRSFPIRFPRPLHSASRRYLMLAPSPVRRISQPACVKRHRMRAVVRHRPRASLRRVPPSIRSCPARKRCTSATFSPP